MIILSGVVKRGFWSLSTGTVMWINGDRGAATCNVNTDGVLPDGIWLVPA